MARSSRWQKSPKLSRLARSASKRGSSVRPGLSVQLRRKRDIVRQRCLRSQPGCRMVADSKSRSLPSFPVAICSSCRTICGSHRQRSRLVPLRLEGTSTLPPLVKTPATTSIQHLQQPDTFTSSSALRPIPCWWIQPA